MFLHCSCNRSWIDISKIIMNYTATNIMLLLMIWFYLLADIIIVEIELALILISGKHINMMSLRKRLLPILMINWSLHWINQSMKYKHTCMFLFQLRCFHIGDQLQAYWALLLMV